MFHVEHFGDYWAKKGRKRVTRCGLDVLLPITYSCGREPTPAATCGVQSVTQFAEF